MELAADTSLPDGEIGGDFDVLFFGLRPFGKDIEEVSGDISAAAGDACAAAVTHAPQVAQPNWRA